MSYPTDTLGFVLPKTVSTWDRRTAVLAEAANLISGPFVYFARRGHIIKIGFSAEPRRRAKELQLDLVAVLPGTRESERMLHETWAEFCIEGEWFEAEPILTMLAQPRTQRGLRILVNDELAMVP